MELDLVHRRFVAEIFPSEQLSKMRSGEVRHADGAALAGLEGVLHGAPGLEAQTLGVLVALLEVGLDSLLGDLLLRPAHRRVPRSRPVHQPQVDALLPEPLQRRLEARRRRSVPVFAAPLLRDHEQRRVVRVVVVPLLLFFQCPTQEALGLPAAVDEGRVDELVPGLQGGLRRRGHLALLQLVGTEPHHRHLHAVVQRDRPLQRRHNLRLLQRPLLGGGSHHHREGAPQSRQEQDVNLRRCRLGRPSL
mmetsp:Transcript_26630/g.86225  ORF Transcript_26630/g.86225 Transcript_26630/m.86225 type:complete len:248 (+) Transcript_26630:2145-2888(+)